MWGTLSNISHGADSSSWDILVSGMSSEITNLIQRLFSRLCPDHGKLSKSIQLFLLFDSDEDIHGVENIRCLLKFVT